MKTFTNIQLIQKAKAVAKLHKVSSGVTTGYVGCALVSGKGNIYLGASIDACCGIGFFAEHGAIANMVANKEYKIKKLVAVSHKGNIIPPCGRCREMIYEITNKDDSVDVILDKNKIVKLKDLLPEPWQKKF